MTLHINGFLFLFICRDVKWWWSNLYGEKKMVVNAQSVCPYSLILRFMRLLKQNLNSLCRQMPRCVCEWLWHSHRYTRMWIFFFSHILSVCNENEILTKKNYNNNKWLFGGFVCFASMILSIYATLNFFLMTFGKCHFTCLMFCRL